MGYPYRCLEKPQYVNILGDGGRNGRATTQRERAGVPEKESYVLCLVRCAYAILTYPEAGMTLNPITATPSNTPSGWEASERRIE